MGRLELQITGAVQGVGFRYAVRERARQLGIVGWVQNRPDGSVTVVAEGPRERLQKFFDWCYTSGGYSRVENVAAVWGKSAGMYSDFNIRTV